MRQCNGGILNTLIILFDLQQDLIFIELKDMFSEKMHV